MWYLSLLLPILPIPCTIAQSLEQDSSDAAKFKHWAAYEHGDLGVFPQVRYQTVRTTSPLVHVNACNATRPCDPSGYVFLSPHGDQFADNKALMLDSKGDLVWFAEEKGAVHNVQVQQYRGSDYITYWVGDDDFWGHGAGYYKLLDQTYELTHVLKAGNGRDGDYHEFSITPDGTALITFWTKSPADLSFKERSDGYIWDCGFQELSIETNAVLFEWRASEYFTFWDMAVDSWTDWTGTVDDPWDWFHLNSVEKDRHGNYLISARYTNAVTYLSGRNGRPFWHLGGLQNSFRDASEGNATRFVDPHMARWVKGGVGKSLTLFDNIDINTIDKDRQQSRGVIINVDFGSRVAKVASTFAHPEGFFARSEGSIQQTSKDSFLVGYGSVPAYTEYSADGSCICDTHFAPTSSGLSTEAVQTYRIMKNAWTGYPTQLPKVYNTWEALYVSWNGATEVRYWSLDGRSGFRQQAQHYVHIGKFNRQSFETKITLPHLDDYTSFRLSALDETGAPLGMWFIGHDGLVKEMAVYMMEAPHESLGSSVLYLLLALLIVGLMILTNKKGPILGNLGLRIVSAKGGSLTAMTKLLDEKK